MDDSNTPTDEELVQRAIQAAVVQKRLNRGSCPQCGTDNFDETCDYCGYVKDSEAPAKFYMPEEMSKGAGEDNLPRLESDGS